MFERSDSMEFAISIALTLSAAFGFIYGITSFFGKESSLYARMITFAVGCAMLSRLSETLQIFTFGEIRNGFQVGDLGIIGSSLFSWEQTTGRWTVWQTTVPKNCGYTGGGIPDL